jgi:hypothetical protein
MSPDDETAKKINNAGWRQGSIFTPINVLLVPIEFDSTNESLIVIIHSCIVVSRSFERDRVVEAMVCKKLPKINLKSPEATGKNQRILHLGIDWEEEVICIAYDINRRFFLDRKLLLDLTVQRTLSKDNTKKLATWVSRYYNRIALPDDLVNKMKFTFLPTVKKYIEEKINGRPLNEEIDNIYFYSKTSENEIALEIQFIFICTTQNTADYLDLLLKEKLNSFLKISGKDGIYISFLDCKSKDQIFVSDLDSYDRFSDWDHLSNLEDMPIGKY